MGGYKKKKKKKEEEEEEEEEEGEEEGEENAWCNSVESPVTDVYHLSANKKLSVS